MISSEGIETLIVIKICAVYFIISIKCDSLVFQIREVGPYVYKEARKHTQIDLLGSKLSYEILRQQSFDEHQTRLECGINCHENDKVRSLFLHPFFKLAIIMFSLQ